MPLKFRDYTSRHCCRNLKNWTARFYNQSIGMRSYLLKSNFKFNLQKHHFAYVYEVIIKCYLNFITCFIQDLRKLFYRGGLSKNVRQHGWPTTKKLKKKHLLICPKAVPKRENLTKI